MCRKLINELANIVVKKLPAKNYPQKNYPQPAKKLPATRKKLPATRKTTRNPHFLPNPLEQPCSSVDRALDYYPKGRVFDSHRGQANFSACPVWIYTQSNIKNIIFTWVHNITTHTKNIKNWIFEKSPK